MRNPDIIELYDEVRVGDLVWIADVAGRLTGSSRRGAAGN